MNFFEHQRVARRNTVAMSFAFILAYVITIIGISTFFSLASYFIFFGKELSFANTAFASFFMWSSLSIGVLYSLFAGTHILKRWADMKAPEKYFSPLLGSVPITKKDNSFYHSRLMNTLEEMSIAAGIPCPKLHVIPNDKSINAFAAGLDPYSALVVVTEGALVGLNRDELQAVMGHELSHIINGDMRSGTIMIALLEGLEIFSTSALYLSEEFSPSHRAGLFSLILFILAVIGALGNLCGSIIRAAFSRQKEYLADASSAQFTRNPQALVSALKKISVLEYEGWTSTSVPPQVGHMTFSKVNEAFSLESHPPVEYRIKRLDPNAVGVSLATAKKLSDFTRKNAFDGYKEDLALGFVSSKFLETKFDNNFHEKEKIKTFGVKNNVEYTPQELVFRIGSVPQDNIPLAQAVANVIPESISNAIFPPQAFILGAILNKENSPLQRQNNIISALLNSDVWDASLKICEELQALPSVIKASVVIQSLPRLKELSPDELNNFILCLEQCVNADQKNTLFERACILMVKSFAVHITIPHRRVFGSWSIHDVSRDVDKVIWFLSSHTTSPTFAYSGAWKKMDNKKRTTPFMEVFWPEFEESVLKLNDLTLSAKENFMQAIMTIVSFDTHCSAEELALVQAICFAIHCPMPPLMVEQILVNKP